LVHLDLSTCQKLKKLPKSMGDLRSLQYLNLEGVSSDTLWGKSSGEIYGQADICDFFTLNGFAPKLDILLLAQNEKLEAMPKQFLKGIENLKVLEPSTSQGKSR
jgi:hypothetical protein